MPGYVPESTGAQIEPELVFGNLHLLILVSARITTKAKTSGPPRRLQLLVVMALLDTSRTPADRASRIHP